MRCDLNTTPCTPTAASTHQRRGRHGQQCIRKACSIEGEGCEAGVLYDTMNIDQHIARSGPSTAEIQRVVHFLQEQELESAFDAGPSSSQQEIAMKGVGTFRVNGEESDRLLRKKPSSVWPMPRLELPFMLCRCLSSVPSGLATDLQIAPAHGQRWASGQLDVLKLAIVVLTAAGLAIFLLWLLFSGGSQQKVRAQWTGLRMLHHIGGFV